MDALFFLAGAILGGSLVYFLSNSFHEELQLLSSRFSRIETILSGKKL